jgi:hypothetical protein
MACTRAVGGFEVFEISLAQTGQATGERPQAVTVEPVADEQRVGVKPHHATVAVVKGVNPREPVMGGGDGDEAVGLQNLLFFAVEGVEAGHEAGQRVKMRRGVPAHVHHEVAQLPRLDAMGLAARRFGPVQRLGEPGVKLPCNQQMNSGAHTSTGGLASRSSMSCSTAMCARLSYLVVALGFVVREVPLQCPLDVAGRGLMAFDEIRVVAVHLPDEVGHPLEDVGRVNLPGEATGGFEDFTGQLGQAGTPRSLGRSGSMATGCRHASM